MHHLLLSLLLVSFIVIATPALSDEIYQYRNPDGTLSFSDRKPKVPYQAIDKGDYRGKNSPKPAAAAVEDSTAGDSPAGDNRSSEFIRTTTEQIKPEVDALYKTLLAESEEPLVGQVLMTFTITADGSVTDCTEDESAMTRAAFTGRICTNIAALNYGSAADGEPTTVNYTYRFGKQQTEE